MSVSSDGRLTADVDVTTGSILLTADFSAAVPDATYNRITVTRDDGTVVRGLDSAPAPGGMARGIDHEAPLGVAITYTASVSNASASVVSTGVTEALPQQVGTAWLKSLRTPALSVQVIPKSWPNWTAANPLSTLLVFGSAFPSVSEGTRQAFTTGSGSTFDVITTTLDETAALAALLASGGPYLLQPTAQSGEPDMYVRVGDVVWTRVSPWSGDPYRYVQLPLTVVARPSTGGSQVALPGSTFADSAARFATFGDRTGTFGSR